MATFSNAQAIIGLSAISEATSTNVSGSVQIGVPQTAVRFSNVTAVYSLRAIIANVTGEAIIDLSDGDTSASDVWAAGAAQVETATCAGTITGAGNATVTVTAAGMTGSPKAISVAVALSDTAEQWASKARAALTADTDVSEMFTVGGATDKIILTRKPTATITDPEAISFYAANDATLNIATTNGTCTGITPAATSADTTAGALTSGCKFYDGDGKDWEGTALTEVAGVAGMLVQNGTTGGGFTWTNANGDSRDMQEESQIELVASPVAALTTLAAIQTFACTTAVADFTLTVIGQ